ncbi:MAG: POTRA domain-containing protein [Myxococcales bacterium]
MGARLTSLLAACLVALHASWAGAAPRGALEAEGASPAGGAPAPADAGGEPESVAVLTDPPPIVSSVELHLPPGSDPAGLAELVAIRKGSPLTKRDVRRSIERLFATGRFADIVVWQSELEDGTVAIVIEASTRTYVDKVELVGNRVVSTVVLRKALGLGDGRPEYYPEFVEQLVSQFEATYQRVGYGEAKITPTLGQGPAGESVLTFTIVEGEPTRIRSITVAGDPQLPIGVILSTLGLSPGSVLDYAALESGLEALRALYLAKRHFRARFGLPEIVFVDGKAVVQLLISAGPSVEFRFRGNRALTVDELTRALDYAGEEPLDSALIAHLEQRVASHYRLMGFADVRVTARDVRSDDRHRSFVTFEIEEGEPLRVRQLNFEGNSHFSDDVLLEEVHDTLREAVPVDESERATDGSHVIIGPAGSPRAPRYTVNPTEVYYEPAYKRATMRIADRYRADGFLEAVVEMPVVERDEKTREARLTLRIKEGPQTVVSEVGFPGAPPAIVRRLAGTVATRKGKPLNAQHVEDSRLAIQRALGQQGHLFARVEERVAFSPDRTAARVDFEIKAGPKVRVGRILVQGIERTDEAVVRGALALDEDEILDPELVAQSQRNLIRLGIFNTVSIRIDAPEVVEEVKDLYVTVGERRRQYVTWGAGYSMVEGMRSFFEYGRINIFGQALQLQARGKLNWFKTSLLPDVRKAQDGFDALGRRINIGVQYPRLLWLLPTEAGLRLDLVHERVIRPSYNFERWAAIAGADVVATGPFSASLQYEVENVDVARTAETSVVLSKVDRDRLRNEKGWLHSLRPSVRLDFRDDPVNPRRGLMISGSVKFVQSLGIRDEELSDFFFMKASGQANVYVPLWGRSVLALSVSGGKIYPLDPEGTSRTIAPKRFFMGGSGTIRGFFDDALLPEDSRELLREQVRQCNAVLNKTGCSTAATLLANNGQLTSEGGELFTLARAELRIPLTGELETALFVDAGNLWLDQTRFDPVKLRYTAGVGLRAITPIGPAALDLGVNLVPDLLLNESQFVPHFSIGLF